MTLAIPTNPANWDDKAERIYGLLESLPGPLTYHVLDGRTATTSILANELRDASDRIANCSIIYALGGVQGIREPIAGFISNESLGTAKLQHLVDDRPATGDGTIPRRTMEMLGVYIRYLYADFDWIQRVTVPSNVTVIDGLFDLRVSGDEVSCITLVDAQHRPKSSRRYGG